MLTLIKACICQLFSNTACGTLLPYIITANISCHMVVYLRLKLYGTMQPFDTRLDYQTLPPGFSAIHRLSICLITWFCGVLLDGYDTVSVLL